VFDLGNSEIVILMFLALLVLGPDEIPPLARRVGQTVGRVRRMWSQLRTDLEREVGFDGFGDGERPAKAEPEERRSPQ
jgi:sec-independent protein translocase protein TatB